MPGDHQLTPYGRACRQCARAKAKCSLRPNGLACERCLRLSKECQPASGARRKPGRKATASKTDQLEERLNGIVSLLETVPGINSLLQQASASSETNNTSNNAQSPSTPTPDVALPPPMPTLSVKHTLDVPDLSLQEQEAFLQIFRTKVKYFPFVHIPETSSAPELRQARPLLWLSIMACCARSASLQHMLGRHLQAQIADLAIVQHQRSLDLLHGVLGFLGWSFYYLRRDPFMIMYSHILSAIVQDLRIDSPPPSRAPPVGSEKHPMASVREFQIKLPQLPERTMEERRALLASFLITVLVALFHKTPLTLPWSDHMEDCLRVLDQEPETPLDQLLVYQVRLQRVALDIPMSTAYESISSPEQLRLIREFQVNALLSRLDDVKRSLPVQFPEELDFSYRISTISIEATIYGTALYKMSSLPPALRGHGQPDSRRTDMLMSCLQLTKQWYTDVFSQPAATFFVMFSFHMFTQLSYFGFTLYRLSSFKDDETGEFRCGWDRHLARQHLNISATLDAVAVRFSECPIAAGYATDRPDGDVFTRWAQALRLVKSTWLATWAKEDGQTDDQGYEQRQLSVVQAFAGDGQDDMSFNELFGMTDGLGGWLSDIFTYEGNLGL